MPKWVRDANGGLVNLDHAIKIRIIGPDAEVAERAVQATFSAGSLPGLSTSVLFIGTKEKCENYMGSLESALLEFVPRRTENTGVLMDDDWNGYDAGVKDGT